MRAQVRRYIGQCGLRVNRALLLAVAVLIVAVGSGSALAAGDPVEEDGALLPSQSDVAAAIESGNSGANPSTATDPTAAEGVDLEGMGRSEALALLNGVFAEPVEAAAGIYDELQGATLLSPTTAVVPDSEASDQPHAVEEPEAPAEGSEARPGGGASGRDEAAEEMPEAESRALEGPPQRAPAEVANADLVDSTIPLQVGAEETIDLSLERQESHLEPTAPLVQTRIPGELGQEIAFPELGIGIEVADAAERTASVSDGSVAFYPNVAEDTDLAISPTPTGVETMSQLRSADSPHVSTYRLSLPAGANLVATDAGGAEVRAGEESLLTVPAPVAIDAAGEVVPVKLEVEGDELKVRVEPTPEASLPILVDPLFQTYEWAAKSTDAGICSGPQSEGDCMHQEEWSYDLLAYAYAGGPHLSVTNGANGVQHGIHVHAEREQRAGDHAIAVYTVPRYFKETPSPTSYIKSMRLSDVDWEALGPYASPYLFMGIWDSKEPHWASSFSHTGKVEHSLHEPSYVYEFTNANASHEPDTHAKAAEIGIFATEAVANSNATAYIGAATVELGDNEPPGTPKQEAIGPWVNQTAPPLAFSATDTGLGVYAISASTEELNAEGKPLHTWKASNGCSGVGHAACPRTWNSAEAGHQALTYEPNLLPSGIDFLTLNAEDPVGNRSASGWAEVKVDHIAPTIAFTGSMTEQERLGTRRASYTLKVTGSDGNAEHPQSGIAKAEVKLDGKAVAMEGKQLEEFSPKCATQNCPLSAEWTLGTAGLAEGPHTVEVIATDAVGNSATKTLTIETRPATAPALSLGGSVTEQGTLGTSRPRYLLRAKSTATAAGFEAPTLGTAPTFASSIGSSAAGGGELGNPADVAVDSSGNAWVVDLSHGRLQKFNEKGEWIQSAGSKGSGAGMLTTPWGLAVDSKNNVWVADTGNNRIVEFNEKGEFVETFGTNVNKTKVEAAGTEAEKNLCTAASGNVCQAATAGSASGQLSEPKGIALNSAGAIWVADTGNSRLEKFSSGGALLGNISGPGSEAGKLSKPAAITVAPDGSIWVADTGNNRIEQWSPSLVFVRAVGKPGSGAGEFSYPSGIEADSAGEIWVADRRNNRVEEFNEWGAYLGTFGSEGTGSGQFGNSGISVTTMGITVDAKGSVLVTDPFDHRLERWTIPGFPVYSSFIEVFHGGDFFITPSDVASDPLGHLWVIDKGYSRLHEFNEKGEWLRSVGGSGTTGGKLSSPSAVAVDSKNNVWVADTGNNRIVEFNEKGEFVETFGTNVNKTKVEAAGTEAEKNLCTAASGNVCQAATAGSASGQLKTPKGIALTSGGNVWVADTANSRIEKFGPGGNLLNVVTGSNTPVGAMKEPAAITVAPDGSIWVADTGNNRIEQWNSSLVFVRAVGKEGTGGGEFKSPAAIEADSSGNLWVGDQKNNRVEEFGEGGRYLGEFGAAGSGKFNFGSATIGIAVAADGSIWVTDPGHSRVQKWTQESPRSEITTILWVDGSQQTGIHGTCKTSGCTVEPQWSVESPALSAGSHTARVKTTDGLGRSTESTISFQVSRDSAKPTLEAGGELVNAPEGWVEQETYGLSATAGDSGFGVTSIEFKIDGRQVASASQSCPDGGCSETLSRQISMASYTGGAHPAEIVATDGAGNSFAKHWTINVDPEGHISTAELEDTVEALETTNAVNLIGSPEEEAIEGTTSGLGVRPAGQVIEATGSEVPTYIARSPGEGVRLDILDEEAFSVPCYHASEEALPDSMTGGECLTTLPEQSPLGESLQTVSIVPIPSGSGGTEMTAVEETAAVAANSDESVDSIIRPLYDGALTFQDIRDPSAPEEYSWEVPLLPGQYIELEDSESAEVHFANGHPAFAITAEPASDAIGTAVPTHLKVVGTTIIEIVEHRKSSFVYPVVSGVGWEGGYVSGEIVGPKDEAELREERERLEREAQEASEQQEQDELMEEAVLMNSGGWGIMRTLYMGPPKADGGSAPLEAQGSQAPKRERAYRFNECKFYPGVELPVGPGGKRPNGNGTSQQCHGSYDEQDGTHGLSWAYAEAGVFKYRWNEWVWLHTEPHCVPPWGPDQPVQLACWGPPLDQASSTHIDILDRARWKPGHFEGGDFRIGQYVCGQLDGVISTTPRPSENGEPVLHETTHFYIEAVLDPPCGWNHLTEEP